MHLGGLDPPTSSMSRKRPVVTVPYLERTYATPNHGLPASLPFTAILAPPDGSDRPCGDTVPLSKDLGRLHAFPDQGYSI